MFDYADGRSCFTTADEPVEWSRLGLLLAVPILAVCLGALCTHKLRSKPSSQPESTPSGTSPTDKTAKQSKDKAAGVTEGKPKDTQGAGSPASSVDDVFQSECVLIPGYQDHYISKAWDIRKDDAGEHNKNASKRCKHDFVELDKSKRKLN